MVKASECSHAPFGDRPTRINRSKTSPLCERVAVRLQVSNVPARNCCTAGVQSTPKSSTGSAMRNVGTQSRRPRGRPTVRQAVGGLDCYAGRSEGSAVMVEIPGVTFPALQGG